PVYALLGGGKFRDKIRLYADTTESDDPKVYAQRMKERKEGMGLTWLKMDLGVEMVASTPGDRKSTRLNSSHVSISYAVFCQKKKPRARHRPQPDPRTARAVLGGNSSRARGRPRRRPDREAERLGAARRSQSGHHAPARCVPP